MADYSMMKEYLIWFNREPIQFFQDKDSDTLNKIGASNRNVRMKRTETAGNPERAICNQAGKPEGSETIMVLSETDNGIVHANRNVGLSESLNICPITAWGQLGMIGAGVMGNW